LSVWMAGGSLFLSTCEFMWQPCHQLTTNINEIKQQSIIETNRKLDVHIKS